MRAWATKAMTFSTWLADLFVKSQNLQKCAQGDIFSYYSPVFEKHNIRDGLGAEVRGMAPPLEIESTFIEMI